MRYTKNQILNVEIAETNMMGFGVVKVDGAVIFVQNAVEGDVCKIRIIKCAKNYYVARIEELETHSPHRIEPACPHFRRCGGCNFQHLSYEHEKQLKQLFVSNILRKEGLSDVKVAKVLSTDVTEGYRNKAQYPVALDQNSRVICGFFSPKTHKVCPIDRCLIQNPVFAAITEFICSYFIEKRIPPYDEESHSGLVRHIFLRIGEKTGEIMLCLVLKEDSFPKEAAFVRRVTEAFPSIRSIAINVQDKKTNVILGSKTRILFGTEKIHDVLCDRRLMISPLSFYQVNRSAAELLYQTAFAMADIDRFDHLIDLYCGIGSIGLSTHSSAPITGIEIIPEAVEDAKKNAILNAVKNAEFLCGDATTAFRTLKKSEAKNPLLILDPPRKGLSQDLICEIFENGIQNVLYISCGPESFARDLKLFRALGYHFDRVQPVDLFPRTGHVENIAFLSRKENK